MKHKLSLILLTLILCVATAFAQNNSTAVKYYNKGVGYGRDGNYQEAAKWYRKAAEQGYKYAQYNLGIYYHEGRKGVPKNKSEAIKWYKKAADQGFVGAMHNLGNLYYEDKNYKEAMIWYRNAAKKELKRFSVLLGMYVLFWKRRR